MAGTYYSGRVHSIIFANPASNYYVARVVLDGDKSLIDSPWGHAVSTKPVTVAGKVPGLRLQAGTWFGFEAKWITHQKFGKQLEITKAPVMSGKVDPETAKAMLTAHGVGGQTCDMAIGVLRDEFVNVLRNGDTAALEAIPSITPLMASHMVDKWRIITAFFKTLEFLSDAKVPKNKIAQVWTVFGDKAQEILSTDPWALVRIDGITFAQADEVALRLELDMNSPKRIRGASLYACKSRRGNGHLYLTLAEAVGEVQNMIGGVSARQVAKELVALHKEGDLVLDRDTKPGLDAVYEKWSYQIESECASLLRVRGDTANAKNPLPPPKSLADSIERLHGTYQQALAEVGPSAKAEYERDPEDIIQIAKAALDDWTLDSRIHLTPKQMEGALNALVAPVSILTGLPGTGKTTTLNMIVGILRKARVPFLLVAPTGIAAKRMAQLAKAPASTIHRGFGAKGQSEDDGREATYKGIVGTASMQDSSDGSGETWKYSPDNPHPARVVICDESSMVDQHLLYRILTSTHEQCRLVLVGDAAQLPSVGAGNVLRDMVNSDLFPTVSLTEIFRQESTSDIVVAAHATHRGEVPKLERAKDTDFIHLALRSEEDILKMVVDLATRLYKKRENFQVISPRHAGLLGVTSLNEHLRAAINPKAPGLPEMKVGTEHIREHDRVMVVKNDYSLGVYNGDVGKVARIDRAAREVEIKLHDLENTHVRIPFSKATMYLRLAYAMTVHKSQGQEYGSIIMPFVKGFGHQLQRNLFYTAITRAKKKVYLLGHQEAVIKAVHNAREDVRNTMFMERLLQAFSGGGKLGSSV